MVHRITHELLRCPNVFHHVWHAASFTDSPRVIEQLDAKLWIWRIGVKVLHAVHAELLTWSRGAHEVKMPQVMRLIVENIVELEREAWWDLRRGNQVNPSALPPAC